MSASFETVKGCLPINIRLIVMDLFTIASRNASRMRPEFPTPTRHTCPASCAALGAVWHWELCLGDTVKFAQIVRKFPTDMQSQIR